METVASLWPRDLRDLRDLGEKSACAPPAGLMRTQQISPHLQRNKQLQDALLQRDEELLRLQDENHQLREFLGSSFVRNLQREAKKLTPDGRRTLKRRLTYVDDGSLQNRGHQLQTSQVSKRVCRNLTAEFCSSSSSSSSSETSSSSEPNLDLWVLRTLGLKDRDTIDTSDESSRSSGFDLGGLVRDAAASSSSGYTPDSSFSPSVSTPDSSFSPSVSTLDSSFSPSVSTPDSSFSPSVSTSTSSSGRSCCRKPTQRRSDAAERHEANGGSPAESPETCTTSPGRCVTGLTGRYEHPGAEVRSYSTSTAFRPPPPTEEPPFGRSAGGAEVRFVTASSRVQTLVGSPAKPPAYWSPLRGTRTPSRDTIQFSPPFSPISSSSPVVNQLWTPVRGVSPTTPTSPTTATPRTPRTPLSRTDLAFSMSLSPSSSVKTHSFPQGQAFVRKDPEGRCNFTWVPSQRL